MTETEKTKINKNAQGPGESLTVLKQKSVAENAKEKNKIKRENLTVGVKAKLGSLKENVSVKKLSPEQLKAAKDYLKNFKKEEIDNMLNRSDGMSIFALRSYGSKLKNENKGDLGFSEMTAQFLKQKVDKNGKFYFEVDLKGKSKYEDYIGAAHLCPDTWVKVAIEDAGGHVKTGYRKVPGKDNVNGTKIGYYTDAGEYIVIYSGYKIYPLEVKNNPAQVKAEYEFYKKTKTQTARYSSSGNRGPAPKNFEKDKTDNREIRESGYFTRSLELFTAKSGEKYYHIVTKANEDPPEGLPRNFDEKWNEEIVLQWAVALQRKFGVPALLTITTAVFESGKGVNRLSYELNNYFGIKPWWRLKQDMNRIARTKYSNYQELGDFKNNGKQDHMHYADKWSSFVRYNQLISKAGRYKHGIQAFGHNPAMCIASNALSGYCPSNRYIKTGINVMHNLSRKYKQLIAGNPKLQKMLGDVNLEVGYVDYQQLEQHFFPNGTDKKGRTGITHEKFRAMLEPAAQRGYVRGWPN